MRLTTKLERWQKAGLLTDQQVAAILEHERQTSLFNWQNGLYFVAVFAILIGVLAVIAANWQQIPGWLKLILHLLVNAGLGLAVLRADRSGRERLKELCLLGWFGLNLTFIGLLGQVFHLAGNLPGALSLWLLLSSPAIVIFSNSRSTLRLWLVACIGTLAFDYGEYIEPLVDNAVPAYVVFIVLLPVGMAALSRLLAHSSKQELHVQLAQLAPLLPILGTSLLCILWYDANIRDAMAENPQRLIALLAIALAVAASFYPRVTVPTWLGHARNLRLLLLVATAVIALPHLLYRVESELLAALSFVAFWLLLGHMGHRNNSPRLVSLSILVVTVRIYIVYLEVFGSLLQTGFGLIASGLVLLAMLKAAQTLNRNLRGGSGRSDEGALP